MTLTEQQATAEAVMLDNAERDRSQIRQTTAVYPDMNRDDAYRVQAAWLAIRLDRGESMAGHKIGLTSRAMQSAMNITTPDSGFITDAMVFEPDTTLVAADFCDPKIEVELSFVLKRELAGSDVTVDDVLDATDYVTPAVELIAARSFRTDSATGRTRSVIDTVSDNAADGGIVSGGLLHSPNRHSRRRRIPLRLQRPRVVRAGIRLMATLPRNFFKARLNEAGIQYGLWVSLTDALASEISAGAGFDRPLIDGERSPNELRTVLGQQHAIQAHSTFAIVWPLTGVCHPIRRQGRRRTRRHSGAGLRICGRRGHVHWGGRRHHSAGQGDPSLG